MADGYRISFPGIERLQAAFAKAPDVVAEEMNRFFAWALPLLQGEIADRAPSAEGLLRRSIIGRQEVTASRILGIVGTPLNYAPAVELGTKPHAVSEAGILALAEWAKRKLPLGQAVSLRTGRPLKSKGIDEAALSAAHAIAWKIRHHGSKGAFMFRDAFAANQARVLGRFEMAWQRIVNRIGGAV